MSAAYLRRPFAKTVDFGSGFDAGFTTAFTTAAVRF
jgi:hypothetical protein